MEKEAVNHTVIKKEIQPVNAQVYCSNYKWQLHISATK